MNLGRVFLGLCACGSALLPAALLAQSGSRQTNENSQGTGRSVLAQPASTSVLASNQHEDLPAPTAEIVVPPQDTQLVAPDAFWLDPGTPYDTSPGAGDGYFPKGFVEYSDALRHVFGGELLLLHPFNEPTQRVYLTDLLTDQTFVGATDPGSDLGIRLWLGMEYGWLGYRVRYTHFGNSEINADPYVPTLVADANTHAFHSTYLLDADVVDFEMTQRFCWHNHLLQGSFGGRYARLQRNSTVLGYGELGEVELSGVATGASELEGAGITFGLNGNSPTGWHGCWSWFWGLRGSVIWADQSAYARTHASAVVNPPTGAGSADSVDQAFALTDNPDSVFIGEAQLGLQYDKPLCCCAGDFFFRIALEYQHWNTGDLIAGSDSFAGLTDGPVNFGGLVESSAFAHDGDLDVLGITIGAGLTY